MNVAQRETLGSHNRHVLPSPGETVEGSVVPPGLDVLIASLNPALRAGLRSGRPSGTTGTLNTRKRQLGRDLRTHHGLRPSDRASRGK